MLAREMSAEAKPESSLDAAVRRELLRLALVNSTRTVPLQLVAIGVVVLIGVRPMHGCFRLGRGRQELLSPSGGSTWAGGLQYRRQSTNPDLASATRAWKPILPSQGFSGPCAHFGIYPEPQGPNSDGCMSVIAIGSMATAALFMSLVGRSFSCLVSLGLGAFVVASLVIESSAVASRRGHTDRGICGHHVRAGSEVAQTTTNAIRLSLERDMANATC